MSRRILRPQTDVCQLCNFITARNALPIAHQPRKALNARALFTTATRNYAQKSPISNSPAIATAPLKPSSRHSDTSKGKNPLRHISQAQLDKELQEIKSICEKLLSSDRVPPESEVVFALMKCNYLAQYIVSDPLSSSLNDGAASALLSLDDSPNTKKIPLHKLPPPIQRIADEISKMAFTVVKHPSIFITPKALEVYTAIQSSLGIPKTFPEVFTMYANKPIPEEGSNPVKYRRQNPNKVENAVPAAVANRALQTAIYAKQLVIAMDIIDSTYTKKAFLRNKFARQGLLPAVALAAAPVAAYTVASQLAILQTTMDSAMATNVAFAGILAYVGFTATIGVVAVTTANDQMDRVTWAQGMPLRERWIREDERAAIDRVAGAWGFRETWRRGEEEGEDWENLREWIGRRGMILDRVELMEGME